MLKNAKKTPNYKNKKFFCEVCTFGCNKKSDFNRHISTYKHINATNAISDAIKKTPITICCKICGKVFKHKSSLYRHKKNCKNEVSKLAKISQKLAKISQNQFICECGKSYKHGSSLSKHKIKCNHLQPVNENIEKNEINPTNNVEHLLKDILEENKVLREKISNLELGNTINNNQQYSINFFLNEKCKNAMNLEDFVEKIKFTLEDLNFTKENGYAKGISNVFIRNLNDMDVTERPIHCSDQKRLQFYVKNDNEWTKDKNNEKIDKTIKKVSRKQIKSIQEWVEANPDYTESDAKMEEYFTLVRSITQPNDDKNLKNIKRKVGENVKLEKSENVK